MKINNIDIRQFKATLLDRNISSNRVNPDYSWDVTLDEPTFFGNALDFKDVLLYFLVEVNTEEQFLTIMGEMAELFRKGATVEFDDIKYSYRMFLKQKPEYTKLNPTSYRLDFVLDSDYGVLPMKYKEVQTNTMTVNNYGLYSTPARLWITNTIITETLTITGFEHTIVLKDIPANANILIDGIDGQLTVNGVNAIGKLVTFHLPKLARGVTQITASATCNLRIAYQERY